MATSDVPPPSLPVYTQPALPAPGLVWTPGYWAYDAIWGFFWVPGTWVHPPRPGLLWTPGYWAFEDKVYAFHAGYWDLAIGFYGGINYGYGYYGKGFTGGYWRGAAFLYNRSATNITNLRIGDVYTQAVEQEVGSKVDYDGGPGGLKVQAEPQENAFGQRQHIPPTAVQDQHFATAIRDRSLRESINHGVPPVAATPRPGDFEGPGVVRP